MAWVLTKRRCSEQAGVSVPRGMFWTAHCGRVLGRIRSASVIALPLIVLGACSPDAPNTSARPSTENAPILSSAEIGPEGLVIGTRLDQFPTKIARLGVMDALCVEFGGLKGTPVSATGRWSDHSISVADALSATSSIYFPPRRITYPTTVDAIDAGCVTEASAEGDVLLPKERAEALAPGADGSLRELLKAFAEARRLTDYVSQPDSTIVLPGDVTLNGVEYDVSLQFAGGNLEAMTIELGKYAQTDLEIWLGALSEKYDLVSPSETEIDDYNSGRRNCLGHANREKTVLISVSRYRPVLSRTELAKMELSYKAPGVSAESIKEDCFPGALRDRPPGSSL